MDFFWKNARPLSNFWNKVGLVGTFCKKSRILTILAKKKTFFMQSLSGN